MLRGTLECAIFPHTGYPPTDLASWQRIYRILKAHGLNHLRFHSWCPPAAAFDAADEAGVLLYVECGSWANQGASVGDGKPLDDWLKAEADRILRWYGNHPSFVLMSYGNEPAGRNQNRFLGDLVNAWKARDPRRLYTSAAGWPLIPENQWHCTPAPRLHQWGAGLQSRLNAQPPATTADYRDFVGKYQVPVVSHEIGQWCVYPNFDEIAKYTGVVKAKNFEVFRDSLQANRMGDLAHQLLMASGKLQTLCYKEEIESALRTPGMGGFELLDLHDFPGQGTALVGVLDPFWDSKPYVSPEEYHRFACETVPLARLTKRVWTTDEPFTAEIQIAHFGPTDLASPKIVWSLLDEAGQPVDSGAWQPESVPTGRLFDAGRVSCSLGQGGRARQASLAGGDRRHAVRQRLGRLGLCPSRRDNRAAGRPGGDGLGRSGGQAPGGRRQSLVVAGGRHGQGRSLRQDSTGLLLDLLEHRLDAAAAAAHDGHPVRSEASGPGRHFPPSTTATGNGGTWSPSRRR